MYTSKVLLAGLAVIVLWASAFPAIRIAAPALGVGGLSIVRLGIAAIALLALAGGAAWLNRMGATGERRASPWTVRIPHRRDLPLIAACGFFGMAAYQVLLNWGELYVPAGTASIIVAAAPLVSVAIAAVTLGERLTLAKIGGSAIALAGVVVVCVARSGFTFSAATLILVAAMVVQGIYHPLTKPLLKRYSGLEVATYGMVSGSIMMLPFLPLDLPHLMTADAAAWWAVLYLGLFPSALGFVLWGYAVARLPVAASTALLYLVPPVAVLIAFVWLGEVPVFAEVLGGVVVIAGVAAVSLGDRILTTRSRRRAHATASSKQRHPSRSKETVMPLVRIDLPAGKSPDYGTTIGDVVYDALVETLSVPVDDRFQVITEHHGPGLVVDPTYLGIARTADAVIIQVTLNEGRTSMLKQAFYKAVADGLHLRVGLDRADVFINLVEVKKENWSFGNGEAQYA